MASETVTFASVKSQLSKGSPAPVYLLHGEEGYYIDQLLKVAEGLVAEADRDFDMSIVYGPQTDPDSVLDACHRYPFMSPFQVVILKEAQAWSVTELKKLKNYLVAPSPTTVLVIAVRGKKLESTELFNAVKKGGGIVFESRKLAEGALATAIEQVIKSHGLSCDPKALSMLSDFVGSDLSRLYNEIEKLAVSLGQGAMVTPEVVERNIGISKEYNNFEFVSAIASRNSIKAMTIVDYFKRDPKNHAPQAIVPLLYNLFSNLLIAQYAPDKSDRGLMGALGFKWPGQLKDINAGLRNYKASQVVEILSRLHRYDAMSKGNGSRMDALDLFQDLVFRILTTPGVL